MDKKPLIVITGPTASGKSSLSLELAERFDGEIISADSMQIYKHMNIGTAKVTEEEQKKVPHHLIDFLDIDETFSVADYTSMAHGAIREIQAIGKTPFLVGGTGLYISSVVDNIQFFDIGEDIELKKELSDFADKEGIQALWDKLNECDPELAQSLHPNNKGRIIRGIEVYKTSGKPLSYWQKKSIEVKSEYDILMLGIAFRDREVLYDRINLRVDEMLKIGLLEEVEELYNMGLSKTANQAIGYKEFYGVIQGTESLEEASERLKQSTRRYAKRQLTWMRGRPDLKWVYRDDFDSTSELLNYTESIIRKELPYIE